MGGWVNGENAPIDIADNVKQVFFFGSDAAYSKFSFFLSPIVRHYSYYVDPDSLELTSTTAVNACVGTQLERYKFSQILDTVDGEITCMIWRICLLRLTVLVMVMFVCLSGLLLVLLLYYC